MWCAHGARVCKVCVSIVFKVSCLVFGLFYESLPVTNAVCKASRALYLCTLWFELSIRPPLDVLHKLRKTCIRGSSMACSGCFFFSGAPSACYRKHGVLNMAYYDSITRMFFSMVMQSDANASIREKSPCLRHDAPCLRHGDCDAPVSRGGTHTSAVLRF